MKEQVYSVKVVTRDELLGRILDAQPASETAGGNYNDQPAQFTTERHPVLRRRWHFRKPALSTDQFKLKVISRS